MFKVKVNWSQKTYGYLLVIVLVGGLLLTLGILVIKLNSIVRGEIQTKVSEANNASESSKLSGLINASPIPIIYPSPTPAITPKPMTFAEMNQKYGPCVSVPILMYHHIQSKDQAVAKKQTGLTVYTDIFKEQMEYLKNAGYNLIYLDTIGKFFDEGVAVPSKSVAITIDDGYEDNYTDAYPILRDLNLKATIFLATGLMENPDYLKWSQIKDMDKNVIYFANHTWSHRNMQANLDTVSREISTAQGQLDEKGLNPDRIFAYPYGTMGGIAENYLYKEKYLLAVDTVPGRFQCKQKRYAMPRIRIGNSSMKAMGF